MRKKDTLEKVYDTLFNAYGPQDWWPGETPFEVVVGAILTQNTNWNNVEKAISALKTSGFLSPEGLMSIESDRLASLIRPSGYFNIKASRLKSFLSYLYKRHSGNLHVMFSLDMHILRQELLNVRGIGPETADSILLYAGGFPVFVVDAYTARIFNRIGLVDEDASYNDIQAMFMDNLSPDHSLFNEYHALIVRCGKEVCRPRPLCSNCPLGVGAGICRFYE